MQDYKKAQEFELNWQKEYIKENFRKEFDEFIRRKETKEHGLDSRHFFNANKNLFNEYLEHIKDKKLLEIGCGSFPMAKEAWQIKDRNVIDPLASEYNKFQINSFGLSFFDNIKIYPYTAEEEILEFNNNVDGVIIFRNALDHSEDPLALLYRISQYAMSGCYLLFWSDIWHNDGGNEGHANITRSKEALSSFLNGLGFDKLIASNSVRNSDMFIEYGGVFRKRIKL